MNKTLEDLAVTLVRFESTHENKKEMKKCLDFCESYFADLKDIHIERINNEGIESLLIQTKKTKTPEILLIGHIDTVPGDKKLFEGRVENDFLYGRGTLDMKAFVATSMQVFKDVVIENLHNDVSLLIVSDEELGGKYGAGYMSTTYGLVPKVTLVPDDGEDISTLIAENKHIIQIKFNAEGVEAHGCRPWDGKNAIDMLIKTYQNLLKNFPECRKAKKFEWVDTINLGTISGGSATNEVPGMATMNIDVRLTKATSHKKFETWLKAAIVPGVTYEITADSVPLFLAKNNPIVKLYTDSIKEITNKKVIYSKGGGATDGRYFAKQGSLVITHQGTGASCQTDNERVYLPSLRELVAIQKNFIYQMKVSKK